MWPDTHAEIGVQARRSANWLLMAAAVALTLSFAYIVPYAGYRSATGPVVPPLAPMLTDGFAGTVIGGMPAFIGALALIYGVLVAGSDYAWDTWKTILVQQPSRTRVFLAKVATVILGCLLLVAVLFAVGAAAGLVITAVEGDPAGWPTFAEIGTSFGAAWLITSMWGLLGVLLAISLRAVALPVGIGLVWMLAVQNLISGLAAPLLGWVDALQIWLPGGASGSLVASLGAGEDTPAVAELGGPLQATLIITAYLVVFGLAAGVFLRRRDI
jgi:ABC-type transport system involved in multi-copper enzyme maturation permease subunit